MPVRCRSNRPGEELIECAPDDVIRRVVDTTLVSAEGGSWSMTIGIACDAVD
jgi:hypothetical protein